MMRQPRKQAGTVLPVILVSVWTTVMTMMTHSNKINHCNFAGILMVNAHRPIRQWRPLHAVFRNKDNHSSNKSNNNRKRSSSSSRYYRFRTKHPKLLYDPSHGISFLTELEDVEEKPKGRRRRRQHQQKKQKHSNNNKNTDPSADEPSYADAPQTHVGALAQHFSTILTDNNTIDVTRLLSACHRFEKAMVIVQQKQSARDLRNNIAKVQTFLDQHGRAAHTASRNMVQLLSLEQSQNIHPVDPQTGRLVHLKDPSCAMGLLWIRRSLAFQHDLFTALLADVDALAASLQAYERTLQPNHGWALQKIYVWAVQTATPSNHEWLARLGGFALADFGPPQEAAVRRDLAHLVRVWEPLIQTWEAVYKDLDLEDPRRV